MDFSSVPVLLCWRFGVTAPIAQEFPVDNQRGKNGRSEYSAATFFCSSKVLHQEAHATCRITLGKLKLHSRFKVSNLIMQSFSSLIKTQVKTRIQLKKGGWEYDCDRKKKAHENHLHINSAHP